MITLMTGVPGTGKTAHIVDELRKVKGRPIYVMGIPELKVAHSPVPTVDKWTELRPDPDDPSILLPYFTFAPNAIVVIDEAQRIYRPRASGAKVPDIVAAFETHRHTGVDFWLLTQGPSLLDQNIRRLVTKHWHIHPTPFGRKLLEWSQCRDPDSKGDRADALKRDYKPNPAVFGLYKSAEVHTKLKKAIPKSLLVAGFCLLLLPVLVYLGYSRISARMSKDKPSATKPAVNAPGQSAPSVPGKVADLPPGAVVMSGLDSRIPVDPARPETAPIYQGVLSVKQAPEIQGCITYADKCKCVTQQGTDAGMTFDACVAWVKNRPFNPYREAIVAAASSPTPAVHPSANSSPAIVPPSVVASSDR